MSDPKKKKKETITLKNYVQGREIKLILPNGEERRSQFAIVELNEIIASHDERTFSSSPGYPTSNGNNVNDRQYDRDPNAQAAVLEYARNLKPELLITTGKTQEGTPIIDVKGIVVSGNNRTMSTKLASVDYPQKYHAYKEELCEELPNFGFPKGMISCNSESDISKKITKLDTTGEGIDYHFKKPFLVRIDYDFPAYKTEELSKYNKSNQKAKRPVDKAIEISAILRDNINCQNNIPGIIGEHDSMSSFYASDQDQKRIVDLLVNCNLITQQEKATYYSKSGFNSVGKNFIELILASIVLDKEALLVAENDGIKSFRRRIVMALPVLMANNNLQQGSLIKQINDAVLYQSNFKNSGLNQFGSYINQIKAFDEYQYSRESVVLNRLIDKGQRLFKNTILRYNETLKNSQAGTNMFGNSVSPSEAFEKIIFQEIDAADRVAIDLFYEVNRESKQNYETLISELKILITQLDQYAK